MEVYGYPEDVQALEAATETFLEPTRWEVEGNASEQDAYDAERSRLSQLIATGQHPYVPHGEPDEVIITWAPTDVERGDK